MGVIASQGMEFSNGQDSAALQEAHRIRLRYGLSENNLWCECRSSEEVAQRVREAAAQIVRLSLYDDWGHAESWKRLETYLTGVLGAGATPMITFTKFGRPYNEPAAIRWFADSACGLVRRAIEQWGPEAVREWFWCLGDQPNSDWLNVGLTFDLYRPQYEAAAEAVVECLAPYLDGQKPRVGGPGIDGFQPFLMDWVYRFVNEIDNRLIHFVIWNRYGEWRQPGEWGSPKEEGAFKSLLMSRSAEYETRARAVGRMLKGRDIISVCGDLNAHSDHESDIGRSLNETGLGAAYYGSSLIHLMRGGADVEMLRSAAHCATPQHFVKQLFARFIHAGDELSFPELPCARGRADMVVATAQQGEEIALLVHRRNERFTLPLEDLPVADEWHVTYKIDDTTNGKIIESSFHGAVCLEGYGVAVLSNREAARPSRVGIVARPRAEGTLDTPGSPETHPTAETRMRLQYGVNEADSWWHFAIGPGRERIWARLRQLRPSIVRIFLFDKHAPDPVREWKTFEAYVEAVLQLGATPMITFAKFPKPADDPRAIRWFAERCGDVVWGAMERWGAEAVSRWYWCVWNEPNSTWIGGGLTFEQYRQVYEAVAEKIVRWLGSHLGGRRPNIGGPAVEGFGPFWMDWVWRFIDEIDPSLVGFVNWHRYTEWREEGEAGAPLDPSALRALILAQTPEYLDRARSVARLVDGSDVLNICGEWNAHSHYLPKVRARFNQSLFGAAYGASVLLQLMRAGVDAEMLWTGTDVECGYGVLDGDGEPTPLFYAKALCAQSIRFGDWISFPDLERYPDLDAVVARDENGRRSIFLVHLSDCTATYDLSRLVTNDYGLLRLLKIDNGSGGRLVETPTGSQIRFDGYGVAALTNTAPVSGDIELSSP